ncbi:hypothetical protein B2K_40390 [Paenibacillus mucilaginosus K02]|uniref:Uncharacterized protein n=1 Tax=Paenibacillus mucilaginosus K02 TaxID=997761 RepID=R9UPR9_9BACL|nr:hypothetical protein B2K_40390 [Paenibacillus mucilaginosus K02]
MSRGKVQRDKPISTGETAAGAIKNLGFNCQPEYGKLLLECLMF